MEGRNITETKMGSNETKREIIAAGRKAVKQLIKVAEEYIIKYEAEDPLSADKLKNAAACKKLAVFDAFEILSRIDTEEENIVLSEGKSPSESVSSSEGFAERRAKK